MDDLNIITSAQNPQIKNILKLDKARERRVQDLFIIEGFREISLAVESGYHIRSMFICSDYLNPLSDGLIDRISRDAPVSKVDKTVFEKIAYRGRSDGMIALSTPRRMDLSGIRLSDTPFVIALESVEKPGNLGAILRTADASKADAVIICDPHTDVYNPNVVRSSIGCVFTQQVAVCTSDEAHQWFRQNGIRVFAAELTASQWYHETDMRKPCAIIMGTEADGLSPFWLENAGARIKIPMRGKIDSLNVSVSTAILTFEAMRQRGF